MDVDRFIVTNEAEWARLTDLARRAGRTGGGLERGEVDDLIRSYQRVSLHLSQARSEYRDPALVARLSAAVAAAHAVIHGVRVSRLATVRRFFVDTFPAVAWTCRRQIAMAALVFFGTALAFGLVCWLAPHRIDLVLPKSAQHTYVDKDFVSYYSDNPSAAFFSDVTTNNIRVGVVAFVLGALGVVPGALILFENGAQVGIIAGLFAVRGKFWNTFAVYVLPHGLLELTCIAFAGAAGFRVGWALFSPGDRSRSEALAEEGRRVSVLVLGVSLGFVGAGLTEGFVTGSALPAGVKLLFGATVWLAFLGWALVRGRNAVAEGWNGSIEELRPSWRPADPLIRPPESAPLTGYEVDPLGAATASTQAPA